MSRPSRAKRGQSHKTLTPEAAALREAIVPISGVNKIVGGFISSKGARTSSGETRVRVSDEQGGLLLTVRAGTTVQELHVYVDAENLQDTRLAICRTIRKNGLALSFRKKSDED